MAYGGDAIVKGTVINGLALWLLNLLFPLINLETSGGMGFIMEVLIYGGSLTYISQYYLV